MQTIRSIFFSLTLLTVVPPAMAQDADHVDEWLRRQDAAFDSYVRQQDGRVDSFLRAKQREYDEFRRKQNEEFARYLGRPWKLQAVKEAVKVPVRKEVVPVVYDEKRDKQLNREIKAQQVTVRQPQPEPQPQPIVPIIAADNDKDYSTFTFYGTKMRVRWADLKAFKLANTREATLAAAYKRLTDPKYNSLLSDCLTLRREYELCDWAYYKMLQALAEAACGAGTSEAVFVQGLLYQESGYLMRYAVSPKDRRLHLLTAIRGYAYDYNCKAMGGENYFLFDGCKEQNLKIAACSKDKGRTMSMEIHRLPRLTLNPSVPKKIQANRLPIEVLTCVNKNLIDFFADYPTSYSDNNVMTRWAYYANTPISPEVKTSVYFTLKEKLQNTNALQAANILLKWAQTPDKDDAATERGVQKGFPYARDNDQWGHDRAFFAEETLYYPFSDCEDHAILYSHLVRDLLGLDVALVYYPGERAHLATAVCFNSDVRGDHIMVDGRRFVIADPTFTGADVGLQMPGVDYKNAKAIVLGKIKK